MRNFQIDGIEMAETAFDQNTCKKKKQLIILKNIPFTLINNSICCKTIEILRKRVDVKFS